MNKIIPLGRIPKVFPLNESRPVINFPDWCDTQAKRLEYRNSRLDWLVKNVYLSQEFADKIRKEEQK